MKSSTIKKHAPLLHSVLSCKNRDAQNVVISRLDNESFDFICECLNKIIYHPSSLNLSEKQIKGLKKKLAHDKKTILYLAKNKGHRNRKRKLVATQTGSGIGIALATALPLIISGIKSLINRKKK